MSVRNKQPRPPSPPGGILVVDKPEGISSMTAVATVRRRAGGVRTGHAGTLDPLASGVLVLGLGKATKKLQDLMMTDKHYRTTIDLSAFTQTDDREGELEPVHVEEPPTLDAVQQAAGSFVGTIMQRPPAFSAVKVGGRRAYKMARGGETPVLEPRQVVVHALEVVDYQWPQVTLTIHSAKGFYVRSLARDLGRQLGTGGFCLTIRREAVGPFDLEIAIPLDDIPEPLPLEDLMPVETAMTLLG